MVAFYVKGGEEAVTKCLDAFKVSLFGINKIRKKIVFFLFFSGYPLRREPRRRPQPGHVPAKDQPQVPLKGGAGD